MRNGRSQCAVSESAPQAGVDRHPCACRNEAAVQPEMSRGQASWTTIRAMRTLFVTDPPPPVEDWLARRRALGQDRFDEVWEGEYHVAPAPSGRHGRVDDEVGAVLRPLARRAGLSGTTACNIGGPSDFRVPDRAYFRTGGLEVWNPRAAIVVEIVSPGDESRQKFKFYHRAGIEEVLIVDPDARTAEWFVRSGAAFQAADHSQLLGITAAELVAAIAWPS
jgi:Uma2 family endonuclease